MKQKVFKRVVVAAALAVPAMSANAEIGNSKYAIGFQTGFATYGVVARMALSDKVSAEGVLGLFGPLSHYGARGLYLLKKETYWDAYAFGSAGAWTWKSDLVGIDDETVFGFGAGGGIEYDWRAFNENLPPISWSMEIGFGMIDLDNYDFGGFTFGAGGRYKF